MTRKQVLRRAEECVCGQREDDYGKPEDNFETIARLWSAYLKDKHYILPQDVAIMMCLLKIARIKAGGTEDSYVDLAGYAACAGELAGREDCD